MKHARPDYDGIQDANGLIPDDEPVFLLRGQDVFAPVLVDQWADMLEARGTPDGSREGITLARRQAQRMREWQRDRVAKVPDVPPQA